MSSLLLKNLPKDSLISLIPGMSEVINDLSTVIKVAPGEILAKNGDLLDKIMIPLGDDLVLDFKDGKERILQRGRSVALGNIMESKPLNYDVRSASVNTILVIRVDAFNRFMADKQEYYDYLKILNLSPAARNFKNYLSEREVDKEIVVALLSSMEEFSSQESQDIDLKGDIIFLDNGRVTCKTQDDASLFTVDTIVGTGAWFGGNALMPPYQNSYKSFAISASQGWRLSIDLINKMLRGTPQIIESLFLEPWLNMKKEEQEEDFDRLRTLTDIPGKKIDFEEIVSLYDIKLEWDTFKFANNDFDSIPVVLGMYASYIGRDYPSDNVKEMLIRFHGKVTPLRLGIMLERLNILSKPNQCEAQHVSALYEQFAFFYGGRLLICIKTSKAGYLCMDGVDGFILISHKEIASLGKYDFIGLMDISLEEKDGEKSNFKDIQKITYKFILADKKILIKMLLSSLIVFMFIAIVPYFSGIILDEVIYTKDNSGLIMAVTGMTISLMAVIVFTWFKSHFSLKLSMIVDDKLSRYLYYHILKLKPEDIGRLTVGGVLNRLGELSKVREFLSNESVTTLINMLSIVLYAAILLTYSFQIIFVPFTIIVLLVVMQAYVRKKIKLLNLRIFESSSRMQTFISETISSIKTVKAFAAEAPMAQVWDKHLLESLNNETKTVTLTNGLDSLISFCSQLLQISGIWIASYLFLDGKMNLSSGDLFGISLYLQRFVDPLNSIVQYYFNYEEVKVTFLKLSDIIPDSGSTYDERHSLRLKGRIRFERVSFRYTQDGPWVVRDVSFSIFPGQIAGIVGKSGSGKTTLASLIAGNLQPTTGRIFYDDFERSFISDESFLSQIGFIEQNNQLYAGSIKSNIAYNDDVPNLDMLDKSIDLSYSKEFISRFPQELDTYLAEGGLGLSGGQKQRLCIARTIYSDPKIMLFDEATSALDSESEKAISDNLRLILKGRTAFIIAHRLGTIRNADVILVVEQGKLVQTGNHDQLIKAEGIYRELFIEQSSS